MNLDQAREAFLTEAQPQDSHEWGVVRSINDDGSYRVQINGSSTFTRCAPCCTAMVGDRVLVLIKANGKCDAIGRLGGDLGGGGTIVTQVDDVSNYVAGRVFAHAGTNDPAGALPCDGRAVSRREYWELFDAIGTTYGAGDGSSTFNLPNIESRTIIGESDNYALGATGGEEKHTLTVNEMPSHSHGTDLLYLSAAQPQTSNATDYATVAMYKDDRTGFGTELAGGNQPHNNMQPYIVMRYFITTGKGDPVSGINPADYVVEWGVTDIWRWEKWASGKAECWTETTKTTTGTSPAALMGGYFSYFEVTFPFEFLNPPVGSGDAKLGTGTGFFQCTAYKSDVTIFAIGNQNSNQITYSCRFVGKWKDSPASGGVETIAPTIAERFEKLETVETYTLESGIVVSVAGNVAEISWYDVNSTFTQSWTAKGSLPSGVVPANPTGVYLTGGTTEGSVNSSVYVSPSGAVSALIWGSTSASSFGCGTFIVKRS